MKFFFDRNISKKLVDILRTVGQLGDCTVVCHDDRFEQNTKDVEWISALQQDNAKVIVVSADVRIRHNAAEKVALKEANLTAFFFKKGFTNKPLREQAIAFLHAWPKILKEASVPNPTIFDVAITKDSKISKICATRDI